MMNARNRLAARMLVLVMSFATVIPLATPARAECNPTFDDPLRKTPAGDTVCGPKATPTPTPTPKPSPTTSPTQQPAPGSGTSFPPPVQGPVFQFPVTNPFTNGFPPFTTPTTQPTTTPFQNPILPGYFGNTQPSLAGHASGSESGFFTEIAVLLLLAVAGAMWLWRGRVRRWMVGV